MLANVALLAVQAAVVAVRPGAEAGCPSSAQVTEALRERLPGAVVPLVPSPPPEMLRLDIEGATFILVDVEGRTRLRRTLSGADCVALAQTVALMVERYLQELDLPAPPPPPPPAARPRWDLAARAAWQPGPPDLGGAALVLGVARSSRVVRVGLAAGATGAWHERWPGGSGDLRRFPLALDVAQRVPAGAGEIQTGALLGLDLLWLSARAQDARQDELRLSPIVGAQAALSWPVAHRWFVRLLTGVEFALIRYDFVVLQTGSRAFRTERLSGKLAVELGFRVR